MRFIKKPCSSRFKAFDALKGCPIRNNIALLFAARTMQDVNATGNSRPRKATVPRGLYSSQTTVIASSLTRGGGGES
jgi:hypothetical protein